VEPITWEFEIAHQAGQADRPVQFASVKYTCPLESAMNAINWDLRNLTVQTHSGLRWSDIKRQLTGWRNLEGLDNRSLEDIGILRGTANLEAAKSFWM